MRLRNPESAETKELCKHEMFPSEFTIMSKPGNPYIKGNTDGKPGAEYPKMLYMAHETPGTGKLAVMLPTPSTRSFRDGDDWNRACQEVLAFNAACNKIVKSEDEELKARGQGWRATADEALALAHEDARRVSTEAAERHYADQRLSENARAEARAFDDAHPGHQPVVPPKRRGRPRKDTSQPAA